MTTNAPKFCPHCGAALTTTAKFCPKCGYAITATPVTPEAATQQSQETPAAQPQPIASQATNQSQSQTQQPAGSRMATNPSFENVKRFSGNYFQWWVATIKQPTQPATAASPWFGALSLGLEALFTSLSIMLLARRAATGLWNIFGVGAYGETPSFISLITHIGFVCLILLLLTELIYVAVGYGFRRLIDADTRLSFLDYINQFAGITNLLVAFGLVTLFVSLVTTTGGFGLLVFLVAPALLILNSGFMVSLIANVPHPRMDKFYVVLLAQIALTVALIIYGALIGGMLGTSVLNILNSLY